MLEGRMGHKALAAMLMLAAASTAFQQDDAVTPLEDLVSFVQEGVHAPGAQGSIVGNVVGHSRVIDEGFEAPQNWKLKAGQTRSAPAPKAAAAAPKAAVGKTAPVANAAADSKQQSKGGQTTKKVSSGAHQAPKKD